MPSYFTLLSAPADEAQARLDAAEAAYAHGDVRAARHEVDEALAIDPQNTDALLLAARLARRTGEPEVAIQRLNELIARSTPTMMMRVTRWRWHTPRLATRQAAGSALADGPPAREPQREGGSDR